MNEEVIGNLTGGTKLMFAGALAAARALGAAPFYFDSSNHRVTFVDNFHSAPIKPIDSVEAFLLLNGDELTLSKNLVMADLSPDRQILTEKLWKNRAKIPGTPLPTSRPSSQKNRKALPHSLAARPNPLTYTQSENLNETKKQQRLLYE